MERNGVKTDNYLESKSNFRMDGRKDKYGTKARLSKIFTACKDLGMRLTLV